MAIKASFSPSAGALSVFGDDHKNAITVSRNAAGTLLVNGGKVPIDGGQATVANTAEIEVFGLGGDDTIALDETNGALPSAQLFGGDGNDVLIGGSSGDLLFGQAGNDTLEGEGGDDQLFGGAGNDTLTGGAGNDQVFGEAGDDRMIWNPGDGSDLFEGGDGNDTAEVNGGNGAETFAITANGTRVRFDRLDPAPFNLDIGTTENLVLNAGGGDDIITASNGLANLIHLTIDGGAGNDTITGGDGNDMLIGGDGNDIVTGGRGSDTSQLGTGDDRFIWNPGDGSDVVDGQDGFDTLLFNGANVSENINISANGRRVSFTRDIAAITMDLDNIERIQFEALGGADNVVIGDLSKTDVQQVDVDLESQPGSGVGDGQADSVTVNATAASNHITVVNSAGSIVVEGLSTQVTIEGAEAANDLLVINALGGNDTIDASATQIKVAIDGGDGNDTIIGGQGADVLTGGAGNDVVTGGFGSDIANLGDGNDQFIWNPGDGSDTVDGGAGTDTLVFNGSNANENIDISANGSRARLFRDVGNVAMDLNAVEHIQLNTIGGADAVTVEDLTGSGVTQVAIDLSATAGSGVGDGQPDTVTVNGTAGDDSIGIVNSGASIVVKGLAAQTTISGVDSGMDSLVINGLAGNDTIDASKLHAGQINLTLNGGSGDDTIIGSAGNDLVNGGQGADKVLLGAGDDLFVWNPGDGSDTVDGQAGNDTLLFNGANVNENVTISANNGHVSFVRDVAAITMDLDNVETIDFRALGGADTITVNDLSKTDVKQVNIDLSGSPGAGDGSVDTVVVNATDRADVINVVNNNGVVTVTGLASEVTISNFEANDRIVINSLGGDDVVQASGLTGMLLTANGGDGDDVLIGSPGHDVLNGEAGDDVLIGNGGADALDGGTGNNILINSAVSGHAVAAAATGGANATSLTLLTQFMASTFVTTGEGHGETPIADPQSTQQPLLAQPHA